ncbi:MAG: glycoside hydrolase family 5 protein [Kineosporiaceae bacterium]
MGSRARRAAAALVAAGVGSAAVVGLAGSPASADTMTQVNATQLVTGMGAGWNLGNQLEASINGVPGETAWGNPTISQTLIDTVKAAGFRSIRIPVSYLQKIGSGPDYTVDAAWLSRVRAVVDYAYGRGLYVVVNMHGDGYKSVGGSWLICDAADQTTIKAKYAKVWQQVATTFQGYGERLILESMNEEFDGQYGNPTQPCYSNINAYNQIFVDTVRRTGGNNASRWLLVPGWNTNIDHTVSGGFVIPTDSSRSSSVPAGEQRLMISAHYYDPWDFTGEENGTITQWGSSATNPSRRSSWGQEDYLDGQFKKLHDAFVVRGYPVLIGEYGSIDKSSADSANPTSRVAFARAVVTTARKYGLATAYWDNGFNGVYGFGLFDRSRNTVTQPALVAAIVGAAPTPTTTPTPSPTTTSPTPGTTTTTTSVPSTTKPTVKPTGKVKTVKKCRTGKNGKKTCKTLTKTVKKGAVVANSCSTVSVPAAWTGGYVAAVSLSGAGRLVPSAAAGVVSVQRSGSGLVVTGTGDPAALKVACGA